MPSVILTDEELAILDGKCSEKIQKEVDAAKSRISAASTYAHLTPLQAGFIADAVSEAKNTGLLVKRGVGLSYCPVCKKSGGYAVYKRSSRFHRKGEKDFSKPLTLYGIELADRFVSIKGYASCGCCRECFDTILPDLKKALEGVRAQLPKDLQTTPFKKFKKMKCNKCGWEGHEGQMRKLPVMFEGYYPGGCPSCEAENRPLGATHIETVSGFVVVEDPS